MIGVTITSDPAGSRCQGPNREESSVREWLQRGCSAGDWWHTISRRQRSRGVHVVVSFGSGIVLTGERSAERCRRRVQEGTVDHGSDRGSLREPLQARINHDEAV